MVGYIVFNRFLRNRFLTRSHRSVLIKIVGPSSKKRLAIRQEAAVIVGTDLTAADGTFSIVGAALPGELDVFAGNTSIGTVTVEPTGAVEDGGDLGTVVEAPIATFVPQCELPSATVISTGTVLAKASLIGADFTAVEKAPDVDSATLTKSSALVNDINIVDGYYELGSYIGLNDAAIKIKLTPPTGKKIVIAGFGIKSTAFSPEREGFRFSVGAEEPGVPVQDSTTFYWEGGCPDDGQLHQVTLSVTYETQWDVPIVSLFLRNNQTIGKWRFEDFEIYGSVVDPTAPTVTTDGPGAATTEAPTGTEATVTTAEIPTTAATTTTTGIACETPGDLPSNFQQWGGLFTLFMHLTDVPSSVADTRFISNVNTWGSGLSRERANDFLVVTSNGEFSTSPFRTSVADARNLLYHSFRSRRNRSRSGRYSFQDRV